MSNSSTVCSMARSSPGAVPSDLATPARAPRRVESSDMSSVERSVGYSDSGSPYSDGVSFLQAAQVGRSEPQEPQPVVLFGAQEEQRSSKELLALFPAFAHTKPDLLDACIVGDLKRIPERSLLVAPGGATPAMLIVSGKIELFISPEWLKASPNLLHAPFPDASLAEIVAHLVEFDIYTEPRRSMELTLDPDITVESRSSHLVHVADLQGPLLLNVAFQFASCLGIIKAPQIAVRCAGDVVLQRLTLDCAVVDPTLREDVRQRMMSIHTRFMPPPTLDQWKQAFGPWWCPEEASWTTIPAVPCVLRQGDHVVFYTTDQPGSPVDMSVYLVLHGTFARCGTEMNIPYIWPSPSVSLFACVSAKAVVASPHLICWKVSRADYLALLLRETRVAALEQHIVDAATHFYDITGEPPHFSAHRTEESVFSSLVTPIAARFSDTLAHHTKLTPRRLDALNWALGEGYKRRLETHKVSSTSVKQACRECLEISQLTAQCAAAVIDRATPGSTPSKSASTLHSQRSTPAANSQQRQRGHSTSTTSHHDHTHRDNSLPPLQPHVPSLSFPSSRDVSPGMPIGQRNALRGRSQSTTGRGATGCLEPRPPPSSREVSPQASTVNLSGSSLRSRTRHSPDSQVLRSRSASSHNSQTVQPSSAEQSPSLHPSIAPDLSMTPTVSDDFTTQPSFRRIPKTDAMA